MLSKGRARGRAIAAALVAALAASPPAFAQVRTDTPPSYGGAMRPDMPAANPRAFTPQPGAALYQVFDNFASWSRNNGSPRILLFWNRALGDDTSTRYVEHKEGVVATHVTPGGAITAYDEVRGMERTTGGTHTSLGRSRSFDYETGFVNAFLRTGANVVDRNALMRKVSTRHAQPDREDQQFIEAVALEQGIDYLVEVLPDYESSPTGFQFTVKITHLPTSRVKGHFRTNGLPENGPSRLVARPGGFERETENRNTPQHIAETLAADTMRRFF